MIDFECPACNAQAQVPESRAGTEFTCQRCGALLEIPSVEEVQGGYEAVPDNSSNATIAVRPDQQNPSTIAIGTPVDGASNQTIEIGRTRDNATIKVNSKGQEKPGAGATCAIHEDTPARKICARCGNFMCVECSKDGRRKVCPDCRRRAGSAPAGFPFNRDTWTLSGAIDFAWNRFQKDMATMVGATFIMFIAIYASAFIGQIFQQVGIASGAPAVMIIAVIGSQLLQQIVQGAFQIGIFRLFIDVARGKRPEISTMFTQFHKIITWLLQVLILMFAVGIPTALAGGLVALLAVGASQIQPELGPAVGIIGGLGVFGTLIYLCIPLVFLVPELAYNDGVGPLEGIKNCYTICEGQRLYIVGASFACGLIAAFGVAMCCFGVLITWPLSQLVMCVIYMAMRNGSGLPPANQE